MQSNGTEYLNNHKMNAFFKTFFASLLAVVAGGILFAVLGVMVLVGIGAVRQRSPRPRRIRS